MGGGAPTSGRGIDARDFTERGSDADNDEGDEDPAPDDVDGAAADERVVERGGEAIGNGGEDKGHEGDLEGGAVARQLGLVAEVLEQLVGRLDVAGRQAARGLFELGVHVAGARGVVLDVARGHGGRERARERAGGGGGGGDEGAWRQARGGRADEGRRGEPVSESCSTGAGWVGDFVGSRGRRDWRRVWRRCLAACVW